MKASRICTALVVSVAILLAASHLWADGSGKSDVSKASTKEVRAMLGNPDVIIIDVRSEWDWLKSTTKIRGAIREEPALVDKWSTKYPKDKKIILYCA